MILILIMYSNTHDTITNSSDTNDTDTTNSNNNCPDNSNTDDTDTNHVTCDRLCVSLIC